jgi:hypothetical protein
MLTMKKTATPEPALFDPWAGCPPSTVPRRDPATDGPSFWPLLSAPFRGVIGGAAIELLAANPGATARDDADKLAFTLWDRIRFLKPDGRHTVEAELHRPEIGTTGVLHLEKVIRALIGAGDVLVTLRQRHHALGEAIRRLEKIRVGAA